MYLSIVSLLVEIPTSSFARSEAQARSRAGNLLELTHSTDFDLATFRFRETRPRFSEFLAVIIKVSTLSFVFFLVRRGMERNEGFFAFILQETVTISRIEKASIWRENLKACSFDSAFSL